MNTVNLAASADPDMLTTRRSYIPAGNINRPGTKVRGGTPDEIVVHETANTNPGANARMHERYTHNGGGAGEPNNPKGTSYHAVVDAVEDIQLLPWDETCYAAGDGGGVGNTDSVNLEICVNRDMDFWTAVRRAAKLVARIMKRFSIPITKIRQHNYRSSYGKDCPHFLRLGNNWNAFLSMVSTELANMGLPIRSRTFPETGKTVSSPILEFWEQRGGLEIFGFPIRDLVPAQGFAGQPLRVQYFERARMELHPDGSVKLGLVGAELVQLKGL